MNIYEYKKYLDKFILCSYDNKKSVGEVFTPDIIINNMLNLVNKNDLKNPNLKWIDNSAGMGHIIYVLVFKLLEELKEWEPDFEKRYKHIIENMIYMSELSEINCYFLKLIFGQNKYKVNLYCGDSLSNDYKNHIENVWKIKNFNYNIENPPYNNGLYKKFIIRSLEFCDKLLYVIPSNWTVQVTGEKLVNKLKNNGLKYLYFLKNGSFKNVDIETLYMFIDKNYKGDNIIINGILTNKKHCLTNHSNKIEYNIFIKLSNYKSIDFNKGKNKTLNYKNPKDNNNVKIKRTDIYNNKLLSRLGGGNKKYYWIKNFIHEETNKIIFPRGTASYNSISKLKNINKDIVYNDYITNKIIVSNSIVYFNVNDIIEGNFLRYYLMRSKLVRFIFIKQNKFGEFTKGLCNYIPYIDYQKIQLNIKDIVNKYYELKKEKKDITKEEHNKINNSIYKYFGLQDIEIKQIESYILQKS